MNIRKAQTIDKQLKDSKITFYVALKDTCLSLFVQVKVLIWGVSGMMPLEYFNLKAHLHY